MSMCVSCLSVCLLAYPSKPHSQLHQKISCMLPAVAAVWSSSDGVVIRYVLPVLRMYGASRGESVTAESAAPIPTKFCSTINISKLAYSVDAHRGKVYYLWLPCFSKRNSRGYSQFAVFLCVSLYFPINVRRRHDMPRSWNTTLIGMN